MMIGTPLKVDNDAGKGRYLLEVQIESSLFKLLTDLRVHMTHHAGLTLIEGEVVLEPEVK